MDRTASRVQLVPSTDPATSTVRLKVPRRSRATVEASSALFTISAFKAPSAPEPVLFSRG